jgi:hypothetical protein
MAPLVPAAAGQATGRTLYAKDLRDALAQIEAANRLAAAVYRERCAIPENEMDGLLGEFVAKSPEWALERGVVHGIRAPDISGMPHMVASPVALSAVEGATAGGQPR